MMMELISSVPYVAISVSHAEIQQPVMLVIQHGIEILPVPNVHAQLDSTKI